jgi:SAM-dependent methyltransferase
MLCYGCCIGPTTHFEEVALPALSAILEPQDRLLTVRDARSITSAYNSLIDEASAITDVEALVLLHDDVALHDRNFAPRVRRTLRDPTVGVIGVVGGSGLSDMSFWDGRTTKGRVWDGARFLDFGPPRGDVDVVDGLLMVLSPAALETVRFDETMFTDFHGYDIDYCLSCRKAGLRVVVEPFVLYHQSTGTISSGSYTASQVAFKQKWGEALTRPSPLARVFSDPVRRSELKSTTAEFRLAARHGLELARTMAGASFQDTGHKIRSKVSRCFGPAKPSTSNGNHSTTRAEVSSEAPGASGKECLICSQPMKPTSSALPLLSCERCQLFATWPPPSVDDSSSDIFDLSYSGERSRRRKQWFYEARQRLAWIESWAPEGILLEVGSATGEFVEEAAAAGYEAIGVEPSKWAADIAQRTSADVLCGNLADWAVEYAGFTVDGVAMFHVLEHIEEPVELLEQCRSVLAGDGKLFIEVPNASSGAAKSLDPSWAGWEFAFHQWHYTPSSLQALLGQAGLEVLELQEITARVYLNRAGWGQSRAQTWSAGRSKPNRDYLRVVAGHAGTGRRSDGQFAPQ